MTTLPALPKYLQIKQLLTDQIRSGFVAPGAQLPPEREIMRKYSVSYATASRAMNELRDAGLVERRWGKGTFVRQASARDVANIAVVFDQEYACDDPYWAPQLKGILGAAHPEHWRFQLFPQRRALVFSDASESLLARLLQQKEIHGAIICSPCPANDMRRLESLGVPLVCVQNHYPEIGSPYVIENVMEGARQLVTHVVDELGHRKLRLVMGPKPVSTARHERCSGLIAAALQEELRRRQIFLSPAEIAHSDDLMTWPSVALQVEAWLRSPNRPTAILCVLDLLGLHVMRAAEEIGLDVPGDLSVAGWYDVIYGSPLTTLQVPLQAMARRAVELLQQRMSGEILPKAVFPVSLVKRQSAARLVR